MIATVKMLNMTCWASEAEPCNAMRQQEKQAKEQEENRKQSPKWSRQYSDDVFIEDPIPTIKPRWAEIFITTLLHYIENILPVL